MIFRALWVACPRPSGHRGAYGREAAITPTGMTRGCPGERYYVIPGTRLGGTEARVLVSVVNQRGDKPLEVTTGPLFRQLSK